MATTGTLPALLASDGGFTVAVGDGTHPTRGYAVSCYPDRERRLPLASLGNAESLLSELDAYVSSNADLLRQPGCYFGGWYSPDDRCLYLDVSRVLPDRADALALARQHHQLAVYDLASGETIAVES